MYHIQSPVSSTVRFTVLRNNAATGIKYITVLAQLCRVFWLLCEKETQGQQPSPIQNNSSFHAVPPMPASKQRNNNRALLVSLYFWKKKKSVILKMCDLTKFLYYSNIFPILTVKFQGTLLCYLFASLPIPLVSEQPRKLQLLHAGSLWRDRVKIPQGCAERKIRGKHISCCRQYATQNWMKELWNS